MTYDAVHHGSLDEQRLHDALTRLRHGPDPVEVLRVECDL